MKTTMLWICLALVGSMAHAYEYWNDIRSSALLPANTVDIRVESPTGAGVGNFLLYAGNGIEEAAMAPLPDGPSTVSAVVPGPVAATRRYGFRLIQGGELDLMPVRIADGVAPGPGDLTRLAEDPAGDELFGYSNLDLVDSHVSFSDDRLYAALRNAGGGFPVNQGLTFFGYLLGVANPAQADPDTVWGLMYTYEQAGIISPGLYRITGTGLGNLTKIGQVEVQEFPETNTLLISCAMADLLADPYLMQWYDPADPALGVAAFTQRITLLGGAAEADRSPGGRCYLRDYSVAPGVNQLPELAGGAIQGTGSEAYAEIEYSDPDGHCPVISEIVFDGSLSFPMRPLTLDYHSTVVYRTDPGIGPLPDDSWATAVFRFSDNQTDVVEYGITATGVAEMDGRHGTAPLFVSNSPNPFSASTTISLHLPDAAHVKIGIYDVVGRLVSTVVDRRLAPGRHEFPWQVGDDGTIGPGSGVYFVRALTGGSVHVRKMVVIR
jgi:hypothetical protein